jgi:hypothetical protein
MATPVQIAQPVKRGVAAPYWSPILRIAFRFCFVYIGLFCAATQVITSLFPIPDVGTPDFSTLWPVRQLTFWVAPICSKPRSRW